MTLITITTVGYQEIHPLSHAGRVFNSFLILFGVSAMFFVLGTVTQSIIEIELQDHYGRRRKKRMIAQLTRSLYRLRFRSGREKRLIRASAWQGAIHRR
jgi:hypothetical protein